MKRFTFLLCRGQLLKRRGVLLFRANIFLSELTPVLKSFIVKESKKRDTKVVSLKKGRENIKVYPFTLRFPNI